MTTPTITLYPDTLPAKGQANAAFDVNVDNFLTWQTATNGPELAAMITWTQGVADTVLATALAGDLPALTGKAGDYIRANAAEDGGEFRTPSEVLADISGAPLASPPFTGTPTAPTATLGTDTTQVATTAFVLANAPEPITTQGAVGTYAYATSAASTAGAPQFVFGTTYAGTGLYPAGLSSDSASSTTANIIKYGSSGAIGVADTATAALSGTWRCMGNTVRTAGGYDQQPVTLFVRIS